MKLNKFGKIAEERWLDIPYHYQEVELDIFVIMPNHIHGIVNIVDQGHAPDLPNRKHSLGNVIGSFKSAATKQIHENGNIKFKWQARFYDRIIRNEKELNKIRKYIDENPIKWDLEKSIPENLEL